METRAGSEPVSILETLQRFCESLFAKFKDKYLCPPNDADLQILLADSVTREFVGMLGSIDCMHWRWKNRPVSVDGQYEGKQKNPTVVLEAWEDPSLWIWHCNFESPGSWNYINILDQSPVFHDILKDFTPHIRFNVNGMSTIIAVSQPTCSL